MRKIIAILALAISLAACGGKSGTIESIHPSSPECKNRENEGKTTLILYGSRNPDNSVKDAHATCVKPEIAGKYKVGDRYP